MRTFLGRYLALFLAFTALVTGGRMYAQVNADNVIIMGRNALAADDYVRAIQLFSTVIDGKPHLATPYYYRAYAKFSLEDYSGAEEDCSRSIARSPFQTDVYLLRGLCRIHNDDLRGAIDDYDHAIKDQPKNQAALYNRTLCYIQLKEWDTAVTHLDHLRELWPTWEKPYEILAQVSLERGDTTGAIVWADSLLCVAPQSRTAWHLKGRYALKLEDFALADSCLSKYIAQVPTDYEALLARASARTAIFRLGGALADYDAVISLVPNHFVAHYNRGLLRAQLGDNNRAIEDFNFVLQAEPDNTLARYNRALLLEETGDYRKAISDYTVLLADYPNFLYGYQTRARLRRLVGDTKGAKDDETKLARANLDLFYKPGEAKRKYRRLRQRNDHSLDVYDKPIEENPDTIGRYVNELLGRVQNQAAHRHLLPALRLCKQTSVTPDDRLTILFLPELERFNNRHALPTRLVLTTGWKSAAAQQAVDSLQQSRPAVTTESAESQIGLEHDQQAACIWETVEQSQRKAYAEAFNQATSALSTVADSTPDAQDYALLLTLQLSASSMDEAQGGGSQPEHLRAALAATDQALQRHPQATTIMYNRACILHALEQTDQAIDQLLAILELEHNHAEAHYNIGVLYLLRGDAALSIPHLSRAGELGISWAYSLLKEARQEAARKSGK